MRQKQEVLSNKKPLSNEKFLLNKKLSSRLRKVSEKVSGKAGICLAFVVIAAIIFYQYRQEQLAEQLSEKILRFHVLANSDSQEDQELKLKVRDAVGSYMQQELSGADGLEESKEVVKQDIKDIVKKAEEVVQEQGYDYGVTASLAQVNFPQKTYGDYSFPAGTYEALQVVIGRGKGKNWWCVMYPNMCFFNSTYEVVEEEAEESLRQVLTAEEYAAIMESGDYEVKFKWLSFLGK